MFSISKPDRRAPRKTRIVCRPLGEVLGSGGRSRSGGTWLRRGQRRRGELAGAFDLFPKTLDGRGENLEAQRQVLKLLVVACNGIAD